MFSSQTQIQQTHLFGSNTDLFLKKKKRKEKIHAMLSSRTKTSLPGSSVLLTVCKGFVSFLLTHRCPQYLWQGCVSLAVSCQLELVQLRTALPEEETECLQAQRLLCLISEAVYLLLLLHELMFRLQTCRWLSVSVVKWVTDEGEHLAYEAYHKDEICSLHGGQG